MRYIIMCGGSYPLWSTPRQLTEIKGEPIVARTIRLLREAGAEDIAISGNADIFGRFGVPVLFHFNDFDTNGRGSWVEAFFPTEEPACYIMGDVVFSPDAIRSIVHADTDSIQFFASAPPFAGNYIKPYAEPFAFKVVDQKRFREAIKYVKANEGTGLFHRRPISWELWQVINGEDVNIINYTNYYRINDYTCDIDHPSDIKFIEALMEDLE